MHGAVAEVVDHDLIRREIARLHKQLAELEQKARNTQSKPKSAPRDRRAETQRVARRIAPNLEDSDSDWVWGAAAIGRLIGRSESQTHYLFSKGYFGDAVWKFSHKHLVASRTKLRELAAKHASENPTG
jgi:hypothetical protein